MASVKEKLSANMDIEEEQKLQRQGGWRVAQPDSCGLGRQSCFYPMRLGYDRHIGEDVKEETEQLLLQYHIQESIVTPDRLA